MIEYLNRLRVATKPIISIVGAGGKTTLLKTLAWQLSGKVAATASTKLNLTDAVLFEEHRLAQAGADFRAMLQNMGKNLLITNKVIELKGKSKLEGLSFAQLNCLTDACQMEGVWLVIEADGAKGRPLKAPADWEPVIHPQSGVVIYTFSLAAVGKPLTEDTVFRSQVYAELTSSQPGSLIDFDQIQRLLVHPRGATKGIPTNSKRILVMNCPDGSAVLSQIPQNFRVGLSDFFDRVFLGRFKDGEASYQPFPD